MSAIQSILLHIDASPRSVARLQVAHQLAEQFDAAVTALYAVMPTVLLYPQAFTAGAEAVPMLLEFETQRRDSARALFDKAVAVGMPRVKWAEVGDEAVRGFSRQGLYADLLLLGQREPKGEWQAALPADFVESVLIDCGKPALVIPHIGAPATIGRTVLVAWKETRESARAVAAALPFLQTAERVHVVTWSDAAGFDRGGPLNVDAFLRAHGVAPTMHRNGDASRDVGDHLLSLTADLGADLLVMGCYGHGRAREWALGGATRTVLQSMTVPVLMAH